MKRGRLTEADAADRMAGVTGTTDYAALADTDLVIEAVFEDLAVKRAVFDALGRACRPDAILATNTSYLDPRAIAEGLPNPVALHRPPLLQPGQRDEAARDRPDTRNRPRDAGHRLRPRREPPQDPGPGRHLRRLHRQPHPEALPRRRRGPRPQAASPSPTSTPPCAPTASPWAPSRPRTSAASTSPSSSARPPAPAARPSPRPSATSSSAPAARARRPAAAGTTTRPATANPRPRPRPLRSSHHRSRPADAPSDIAAHLVAEMAAEGAAILAEGIAAQPVRHRPRRDPRLRLPPPARRPDVRYRNGLTVKPR